MDVRISWYFFLATFSTLALFLVLKAWGIGFLAAINITSYFLSSVFLFRAFINTSGWIRALMFLLLLSSVFMLTYQLAVAENYSASTQRFLFLLLSASFISTILLLVGNFAGFSDEVPTTYLIISVAVLTFALLIGSLEAFLQSIVVVGGLYLLFNYKDAWFLNNVLAFSLVVLLNFVVLFLVSLGVLPKDALTVADSVVSIAAFLFSFNLWKESKELASIRLKAISWGEGRG